MIDIIGWVGSICFSICAIPQAYKSVVEKHSIGVSWSFLLLWLVGELCTIIYVLVLPELLVPLIVNYILNLGSLIVIIYFKIYGTKNNNSTSCTCIN